MLAADYPAKGITLTSCALVNVDGFDSLRGIATSNTLLNIDNIDGYKTSSVWTLRVYR